MADERMGFEGTMSKDRAVRMLRFEAEELERAEVRGLVKVKAQVEGDIRFPSPPPSGSSENRP